MQNNTTIVSLLVVNFLSLILPLMGLQIANASLTNAVQVAISIIVGIWLYVHHKNAVAAAGANAQG
jgi:hypothetical protein